jgi:hypothetical protein
MFKEWMLRIAVRCTCSILGGRRADAQTFSINRIKTSDNTCKKV